MGTALRVLASPLVHMHPQSARVIHRNPLDAHGAPGSKVSLLKACDRRGSRQPAQLVGPPDLSWLRAGDRNILDRGLEVIGSEDARTIRVLA